MAQNIRIKATGQPEQLLASYDAVIRKQGKIISELRKVAKGAKETGRSATGAGAKFLSVGKTIATSLGAGSAALAAVRLISAELERTIRLRDQAKGVAIELGGGAFGVAAALPSQITDRGPAFIQNVLREAQKAGAVLGSELQAGLTSAGSSLAAGSPELLKSAVVQGARISGRTPGADTGLFAGAALKLQDLVKTDDARVLLGTILSAGRGTQITDPRVQAQNIPRALALISGSDPKAETSLELFSTLAQFTKDPTGLQTGTIGASIAGRVRSRPLPIGRGGAEELLPENIAAGGTLEALGFIRDRTQGLTREQRNALITQLAEGESGKAFLKKFFARDEGVSALISQSQGAFGPLDTQAGQQAAIDETESLIAKVDANPRVQQLLLRRRGQVVKEGILKAQPGAATQSIVREGLKGILEVLPAESAISGKISDVRQVLSSTAEQSTRSAIDELEDAQAVLRTPLKRGLSSQFFTPDVEFTPEAVKRDKRLADELQPLIDALKESIEATNRNTQAVGVNATADSTALLDAQGGE